MNLHLAAAIGDDAWARELIDAGANVRAKSKDGRTPLHLAMLDAASLEHFFRAHAGHLNGRGKHGRQDAEGQRRVAQILIDHGAAVSPRDEGGATPLMLAARCGRTELVKLLLEAGADVEERSDDGTTPLIAAAANGERPTVELLITKGADVKAKDGSGRTALHAAAWGGDWRQVALLLISKGADVSARDAHGQTPLHDAARFGSSGVADVLIRHGADVNAKDNQGHTPLHAAREGPARRSRVVDLLHEKGASD